ncbi:plasmid mobilization protein [Anaerorhabdus furcosa]|uniref:Mobilisation protein (MobC) n=1 Tax=Anaerorhabdus furcosa TaxID=118967 RepID=A0A1T4K3E2_9FIRM|nr:plasmid mobilization relaxosome protein MobC [Anaerorhabdus furcosa]SJZ36797.1 mobilisation protein (MobC) [Anaerorhabdus furcosa]
MKNKVTVFKTTESDFEKICDLSCEAGLTKTDFIVRSCLNKKVIRIDDLKETYIQLKKIGNNVNQLTVLANMNKVEVVNLQETQSALNKCLETLVALQERIH